MEVRILGPIRIERDGHETELGPRQATLLVALLTAAGQTVPTSRLCDLLWAEAPPPGAATTLRSHVLRLRRALGDAGDMLVGAGRGDAAGYALRLPSEHVDAARFARLVEEAGQAIAAGDPGQAAGALEDALRLWRGPALDGAAEQPFARAEIARLEDLRWRATLARWEALLALGRHRDLVPTLEAAFTGRGQDERLRRLLVLALFRRGERERAEAICREGIEQAAAAGLDAPELQRLHARMGDGDPGLGWTPPEPHRPCTLPPDIAAFTGREAELARLRALLTGDGSRLAAVTGMPGAGKTALAVHVAHLLRDAYPDGQLFVDLQRLPDVHEALGFLLRADGMPAATIPDAEDDRRRLYEARLARRRVLIVIDGARDEEQAGPLLPAAPRAGVIVTSHAPPAGLDAVAHLRLDPLAVPEAIELLGRIAGPERVRAEPAAAREIVLLAGCLPRAVRIAGARLAARPHHNLAHLAGRLAARPRLDELACGDLELRTGFALAYASLDGEERRAFRALGRRGAPATAAQVETAAPVLERLVARGLAGRADPDAGGPPHYRLPDLLALYARELAEP